MIDSIHLPQVTHIDILGDLDVGQSARIIPPEFLEEPYRVVASSQDGSLPGDVVAPYRLSRLWKEYLLDALASLQREVVFLPYKTIRLISRLSRFIEINAAEGLPQGIILPVYEIARLWMRVKERLQYYEYARQYCIPFHTRWRFSALLPDFPRVAELQREPLLSNPEDIARRKMVEDPISPINNEWKLRLQLAISSFKRKYPAVLQLIPHFSVLENLCAMNWLEETQPRQIVIAMKTRAVWLHVTTQICSLESRLPGWRLMIRHWSRFPWSEELLTDPYLVDTRIRTGKVVDSTGDVAFIPIPKLILDIPNFFTAAFWRSYEGRAQEFTTGFFQYAQQQLIETIQLLNCNAERYARTANQIVATIAQSGSGILHDLQPLYFHRDRVAAFFESLPDWLIQAFDLSQEDLNQRVADDSEYGNLLRERSALEELNLETEALERQNMAMEAEFNVLIEQLEKEENEAVEQQSS